MDFNDTDIYLFIFEKKKKASFMQQFKFWDCASENFLTTAWSHRWLFARFCGLSLFLSCSTNFQLIIHIDRGIRCCNQTSYYTDFSSRGSSLNSWFVCIQDRAVLFWRRDENLALDAIEPLLALGMYRNSSLIDCYTLGNYSIGKQVQMDCRSYSPCTPCLINWKFWIF